MSISFIIPYHPDRTDNLLQTLRFLSKREPELQGSELILMCNTEATPPASNFGFEMLHVNMRLTCYRRTTMLNEGAKISKHHILALLDSDRILPQGYFTKVVKNIKATEVVTTEKLYRLPRPYTDDQIERKEIDRIADFRSIHNVMRKKNLFAGNTVMWKDDFLRCGGFDESYSGYGFADTDMTATVIHAGLKPIYLDDEEWHLHHDAAIWWNGCIISRNHFKVISAVNGLIYCRKWGIRPDQELKTLLKEVKENEDSLPQDLKALWSSHVSISKVL